MKLLAVFVFVLALLSLTAAFKWTSEEDKEVEPEQVETGTGPSSRIAHPKNFFPVQTGLPQARPASILNSGVGSIPNSGGAPLLNSAGARVINNPPVIGGVGGIGGIGGNGGFGGIGGGLNQLYFPAVRITVSEESDLYIPPGAEGRIIVILRNDGVGDFFLISGGDDKNFFQQFEYSQVQLGPGQSIKVAGRIRVPVWATGAVATMNVIVQRRTDAAISQRRIYIHARAESGEGYAPWCTVTSVTRCDQYIDESICANQFWNFRVGIQDNGDSGLLSISMKPDGRFIGEDFPVGTNQSVQVERMISCCTTGVDITAIDVRGNRKTCRVDQYTLYLRSGEIAAVVLGVLFLIIIIIVVCFLIVRCCKRRKSRSVSTAPLPRSKKDQK